MTSQDDSNGIPNGVPKKNRGGRPKGAFSDPFRMHKSAIVIALNAVVDCNNDRPSRQRALPEGHLPRWATLLADPDTRIAQIIMDDPAGVLASFELKPAPNLTGEFLKNKVRTTAENYSGAAHGQSGYQGAQAAFVQESARLIFALFMFHDLAIASLSEGLKNLGWDERVVSNLQSLARYSNLGNPRFTDLKSGVSAIPALMQFMGRS